MICGTISNQVPSAKRNFNGTRYSSAQYLFVGGGGWGGGDSELSVADSSGKRPIISGQVMGVTGKYPEQKQNDVCGNEFFFSRLRDNF